MWYAPYAVYRAHRNGRPAVRRRAPMVRRIMAPASSDRQAQRQPPVPSVAAHVIQKQQSPTGSRSCIAKHFAGVKNPFHKFTGACFVQVSIGQTDDHKPAGSSLPTPSWTLSDSQNLGENMSKGIPALRALAVAAAGAAALCWSAVVPAQETPPPGQAAAPPMERIEVTGSLIKRIEGETALPVTVVTKDEIQKSGATTVEE